MGSAYYSSGGMIIRTNNSGSFSDQLDNSIRKTEYPISNPTSLRSYERAGSEYPTDLSACTHRQMKGRKYERNQRSEKINFFLKKMTN